MAPTLTKAAAVGAGQASVGVVASLHPEVRNVPRQSIDELVGTVAHELRNPLASVLTGVYMVTSEYPLDRFEGLCSEWNSNCNSPCG